nr:SDR family NAD(P)-dependent oxidoreductase [Alloiococcus otitis]
MDIFFNNAGIEGKVAPIHEQSFEDFTKVLDVNVNGVFLGMKYVVPVMLEAGRGSIINMASVAGLDGSLGMSPYNASKHAVVGLTKAAALELAADNVRVNSVHPSPVNTRMMRAVEEGMGSSQEDMSLSIPIGRYAESSDISNLVLFLADDASDFITGVQYRVDGGMGV